MARSIRTVKPTRSGGAPRRPICVLPVIAGLTYGLGTGAALMGQSLAGFDAGSPGGGLSAAFNQGIVA